MIHLLFVCHGNICRSPMAEFMMKDLVQRAHLEKTVSVSSVAATTEEIGHDMYPPARRTLAARGIPFSSRKARLITQADCEWADLILVMDDENVRSLHRRFGHIYDEKIHWIMDFAGEHREVADPWYTDDFDQTYDDILRACEGLIKQLRMKGTSKNSVFMS